MQHEFLRYEGLDPTKELTNAIRVRSSLLTRLKENSMEFVLGLDCDGVVLDYLPALMDFARFRGHHVACEPHEVDSYDMSRAFPGMSAEELFKLIGEFSVHDSFADISEFAGFTTAISKIRNEFPSIRLIAITSAGTEERTAELRRRNLAAYDFEEVHVLPLGASKKEHLRELPAGSIFVDDLKKHVNAAEEVGHTGVLVRQPYNTDDDHHHVFADWNEGYDIVSGLIRGRGLRFAS